eukprot:TRINITY_DN42154_c0_g1_i1.p1 TRINITY_DN42154_c0_g1~~TRINITY_DN42154_c0_g1_i1.p1  ORF type:complete len:115 (-),score=8.14 TRINITY_DN42154_c0_g1_i1:52-396(-)
MSIDSNVKQRAMNESPKRVIDVSEGLQTYATCFNPTGSDRMHSSPCVPVTSMTRTLSEPSASARSTFSTVSILSSSETWTLINGSFATRVNSDPSHSPLSHTSTVLVHTNTSPS